MDIDTNDSETERILDIITWEKDYGYTNKIGDLKKGYKYIWKKFCNLYKQGFGSVLVGCGSEMMDLDPSPVLRTDPDTYRDPTCNRTRSNFLLNLLYKV